MWLISSVAKFMYVPLKSMCCQKIEYSYIGYSFKACFHYEREMEHSLFVLLIFPRLKSKQALSEAKKSIKQSKKLHPTLVVKQATHKTLLLNTFSLFCFNFLLSDKEKLLSKNK